MKSKEKYGFYKNKKVDFNSSLSGQQKNIFRNVTSLHSYFFLLHFLYNFLLSFPSYCPIPPLSASFFVISSPILPDNVGEILLTLISKLSILTGLRVNQHFSKLLSQDFIWSFTLGNITTFYLGACSFQRGNTRVCAWTLTVNCTPMAVYHTCTTGNSGRCEGINK